jgi:hypothetical protein
MVRTTVTVRRIAMAGQKDLRLQVHSSGYGRVEVVDFKPQEHTISMRKVSVANGTVMMLHVPTVQLKNQPALRNEPLILGAAMVTLASKETLIPETACLNVSDTNQGLWAHMNWLGLTREFYSTTQFSGRPLTGPSPRYLAGGGAATVIP